MRPDTSDNFERLDRAGAALNRSATTPFLPPSSAADQGVDPANLELLPTESWRFHAAGDLLLVGAYRHRGFNSIHWVPLALPQSGEGLTGFGELEAAVIEFRDGAPVGQSIIEKAREPLRVTPEGG